MRTICRTLTMRGDNPAMPNYIRPNIPGARVFFTVAIAERGGDLLVRQVDALRAAVVRTLRERPVRVQAWVVLPDHMHCIWDLPEGDADYARRWQIIKARFSRHVAAGERRSSHVARRERAVWQRRYWEHHIRDERDFTAHVEYCRINPVKHGLVEAPEDWPYSSFRRGDGVA